MKLIHDCVRDVMLNIENNLKDNSILQTTSIQKDNDKYSIEDINYTCKKLAEANYITIEQYIGGEIIVCSMTFAGHQFLDNIRDNKIWKQTKKEAAQISGISLPILQQLAQSIILKALGLN